MVYDADHSPMMCGYWSPPYVHLIMRNIHFIMRIRLLLRVKCCIIQQGTSSRSPRNLSVQTAILNHSTFWGWNFGPFFNLLKTSSWKYQEYFWKFLSRTQNSDITMHKNIWYYNSINWIKLPVRVFQFMKDFNWLCSNWFSCYWSLPLDQGLSHYCNSIFIFREINYFITSNDRLFSWPIIYTDNIHHAILFIETLTRWETRKPIR